MKITAIYVYPIKALRGIPLQTAKLGPQGITYDRHFMLFKEDGNGKLKKVQLSSYPQCALFEQEIVGNMIVVQYHIPNQPIVPEIPALHRSLEVPLEPELSRLEKIDVDLHGSPATAYRMGKIYDDWFTACFGFSTILVYLGDGQREALGMFPQQRQIQQGWLSSLSSYVMGPRLAERPWLTFTDCAPLLITTESSLTNVSSRLPDGDNMSMYKFRPNIVVDGEDEWAEDFWAEVVMAGKHRLLLTGNCGRCSSINVDYETGRQADGELGTMLKKLMKDRRVDKGNKWSPTFGRYAYPAGIDEFQVAVGDDAVVDKRLTERAVWDWPGIA